jgi:hypothetical protein
MCHTQLSGNDIILCDMPEPRGARGVAFTGNLSTASENSFLASDEITTHGYRAVSLQSVQLS